MQGLIILKLKNLLGFIFCVLPILLTAQNPTAFACSGSDGFGYYISSATSSQSSGNITYSSSRLSKITSLTGARVTLCTDAQIGVSLNGLAFNPHDNFLYAVSRFDATQFSGKLYRIGENCQKVEIPVTGGIISFPTNNRTTVDNAGGNIGSGTFDLDNHYYVNTSFINTTTEGFTNKLQKILLTNNTATVESTVTLTCPSCTGTTRLRVTDVIYDEASGQLLGSNKETDKLYSINPVTGVLTEIGSTGITTVILGIYKNRNGDVRAMSENGNIYSVNLTSGAFTLLSTATNFNTGNADAASGCYDPPKITGHLYIDAAGLTDNIVNGLPTDVAGSVTMYVNLISGGNVVKTDVIDPVTGSFKFLGLFSGSYEVQISSTLGIIGQAAPSQNLPTTYINTGENIGAGAGNDGNPNGRILVGISNGNNVEEINFGIDGRPVAQNITGTTEVNPGGIAQVVAPTLVISDPEESSISNITVESLPNPVTMGVLYYNGIAVTVGQVIPNYMASLMTLDPVDGVVSMVFTYSTTDMAGVKSNIATVTKDFTLPVPIELISFDVKGNRNLVTINWATASEIDNDYFVIERSSDGFTFSPEGYVDSYGDSKVVQNYQYELTQTSSKQFYRLKQVDFDGKHTYSRIEQWVLSSTRPEILIYPTLVEDRLVVQSNGEQLDYAQYNLYDSQGRLCGSGVISSKLHEINVESMIKGVYILVISDKNGNKLRDEIIVKQ